MKTGYAEHGRLTYVNAVTKTAHRQRSFDTESIRHGPGEEADHRYVTLSVDARTPIPSAEVLTESGVQRNIRLLAHISPNLIHAGL